MALPTPTDPFLSVQTDVLSTLRTTRTLFSSYLRIRSLASSRNTSSSNPELTQARSDLQDQIQGLLSDVEDLKESIAAVEGDPYAFGLDVAEVQRRRGFVRDVSAEVGGMRKELTSGEGQLPQPEAFDEGDDEDSYAAFEHQTQTQMMTEQDDQLDDVSRTVGALRGQAVDMGRELEEQHGMLEDVDGLADRVGGKLQVGVKKVGEVIRRNEDGVSSCCIGILGVVLVLLLILVVVL